MISPSLLNPVAVAIAKTFPVSCHSLRERKIRVVTNSDENLYVGKVDYQISDKNQFSHVLPWRI